MFSEYENLSFKWGVNDCCLFSANVIRDKFNIDIAKSFRNKYSTENEANSFIKKYKNIENLVTATTKVKPKYDFTNIKQYSLVLRKGCLGINNGVRSYFLAEKGLIKVPNRACECYWDIDEIIKEFN